MKIIAACGNDCSVCPRYNAPGYEKTDARLHATAVLWQRIGYRDHVITNEEISCPGCRPENWCRYGIAACTARKGITDCGKCPEFPCDTFSKCLEVTTSFRPACRKACTAEEYEVMERAFFEKEKNLTKNHTE